MHKSILFPFFNEPLPTYPLQFYDSSTTRRLEGRIKEGSEIFHLDKVHMFSMVRYSDFETFSKQTTLSDFTNDTHAIFQTTLKIINTIRLKDRIRLLGVSLSSFIKDPYQISLIEEERKRKHIILAIDYINDTYGDFKITWGSYMQQKRSSGVISPAWRPSGVKNITVK